MPMLIIKGRTDFCKKDRITEEELLQITHISPEAIEVCEEEKFIPRLDDTLWLGTTERKFYPDYIFTDLYLMAHSIKAGFPFPTIKLIAAGSLTGKVAYEKEMVKQFGDLCLIKDGRKNIPEDVMIDLITEETRRYLLKRYPEGELIGIIPRQEEVSGETFLIISRITYFETQEEWQKEKALQLWQPHYSQFLTDADLNEITTNITGYFSLLNQWAKKIN